MASTDNFLDSILATASDFLQTYDEAGYDRGGVDGLEALARAGLELPIAPGSPHFRELSTLALIVHLTGSIDKKFTVKYYHNNPTFAGHERVKKNLSYFPTKPESDSPHSFKLNKSGAPIGRLLSILGVHHSGRKKHGVGLPDYLAGLSSYYARTGDREAETLMHDAIAAIFFAKLRLRMQNGLRYVEFPAQIETSFALLILHRTAYVMQAAFPETAITLAMKPRPSNSSKSQHQTTLFIPRIYFSTGAYEGIKGALEGRPTLPGT